VLQRRKGPDGAHGLYVCPWAACRWAASLPITGIKEVPPAEQRDGAEAQPIGGTMVIRLATRLKSALGAVPDHLQGIHLIALERGSKDLF